MSLKMACHRATVEDVEVLVSYRLLFLAEHFAPPKEGETDLLRNELRDYFLENIPKGTFTAWLAESREQVLATSGMVVWKIPANNSIKNGKQGYILNMYTVPEARGMGCYGLCATLLEKLIDEAKALGLCRVHLHASKMGEPIYRKRGFREPGDVELVMRIDS